MNDVTIEKGPDAAVTATGPDVVIATNLTALDSANMHLLPDENLPSDGELIDGAALLDRIHAFARRFICYPSDMASIAHVLWIAHTHLMDAWFSTGRLAVLSPEPGSGKSRVLEITALLVPNALFSVNASAAYILRKVADQENRPTILYDEIDTIFGPAARGNEDLRGMVNAGYRRGAVVGRCNTERGKVQTVELATYAAVAMGGLGNLPDTIMTRSVIIRMRKRAAGEKAEPFQPRVHEHQALALQDELAGWASSIFSMAEMAEPEFPDAIVDRNADVWGPLFVVADLAGGHWPQLARRAAMDAVMSAKANERPSLGVQLLVDIRTCFGTADRITTAKLIEGLLADEEAPWGDLKGRKIDARKLGQMLRSYGIRSVSIRMPDGSTPKGYRRADFLDAWERYLPKSGSSATNATSATGHESPEKTGGSGVADDIPLPPCGGVDHGVADPKS
ncbi:DUF3631 domain-containing protein [Sphingobium sp. Ant17]|uniref:DUF3631 domain-containing protein n=1 Tax=Sphingobium sp. Ant17 TaxID=1461752 RepID=UPI0004B905F3|nr:DUF3631 domain-containing protein [Sphingobium sp. Ant17]